MPLLRTILVLGACLHLTGGHWGVLQGIAWVNMLVEYSASDGIVEGARKTFDGQHPCCLCKSIAAGKEKEREDPKPHSPASRDLELKPVPLILPLRLSPPGGRDSAVAALPEPAGLEIAPRAAPPVPPPRGLLLIS